MNHEREGRDPFREARLTAADAVSIYTRIISQSRKWDPETAMHVGIRYVGYTSEFLKYLLYHSSYSFRTDRHTTGKIDALDAILDFAQNGIYAPLRVMLRHEEFIEGIQQQAQETNPLQALIPFINNEGHPYHHIPAIHNQEEIQADVERFLGQNQP